MIESIKNMVRYIRQKLLQINLHLFLSPLEMTDKNILIIAPHPDDETFGCAGLIRKKVLEGTEVSVVFLTNGEKSLQNVSKDEIAKNRKKSAIAAMKLLGVEQSALYWLELPDGEVPCKGNKAFKVALNRLLSIIKSIEVEEIFTTSTREGWSDHLAAYELAVEAVKNTDKSISLYLYWVWVWYYVGVKQMFSLPWKQMSLLPIQDIFKQKEDAMKCHFKSKTISGEPYIGHLPLVLLDAFQWPYEVYEKVNLNEI